MSKKNKYGLGYFKQHKSLKDSVTYNRWMQNLQATAYRWYVITLGRNGQSSGKSTEVILKSHYDVLRRNYLADLKTEKDQLKRHRLRVGLIAIRMFRELNNKFVDNSKQESET